MGRGVGRLGWGLVDQAASSVSNFAVVLYVVRTVGATQFGAFSLAYVTYGFVLSASRGLATAPLQVRFSGTGLPAWRRAVAGCTGNAAVAGLLSGLGVLLAAALMSGTTAQAFFALGLMLPGLLLQDSWRYAFFALGRGSQAFLNDMVWVLAMVPFLGFMRATHHRDVFSLTLAWGAAAAVAAVVGIWQAHVVPRPAQAWEWVRRHGDLGVRYLVENTSINGANQLRTYAVGIIVGLAAVGYLQAVNTLMGPFMVIYFGMTLVTVPEAVRALHRSPQRLWRFCVLLGAVLATAGLAWGAVMLVALPRGLGEWVLGPIWRPAYPLVLPLTISTAGACIGAGATAGLHALGAARRSLRAELIGSVLFLVSGLAGAFAGGVIGTVWGVTIATWIGSVVWWRQMRVAMREVGHETGGSGGGRGRTAGRHRRPGSPGRPHRVAGGVSAPVRARSCWGAGWPRSRPSHMRND